MSPASLAFCMLLGAALLPSTVSRDITLKLASAPELGPSQATYIDQQINNFRLSERQSVCSETSPPDSCPPGMFCNLTRSRCECGVYPNRIITCNRTSSFVLKYYCATYDEKAEVVIVGSCLRYYKRKKTKVMYAEDMQYHVLPRDETKLNNATCSTARRTGTLCGRCLPDHYPLAYSFNLSCVACPDSHRNWLKYVAAAYIPLTLFYIVVIFFKLNTTSSHLFAVIFFCQTLSTP